MLATGGTWDRGDGPLYFLAGDLKNLEAAAPIHPWLLLAINELSQRGWRAEVQGLLDAGARIMLDSGVWWLVSRHARRHNLPVYDVQRMPGPELDGWAWLWSRYHDILAAFEDRLWGYVELDQGGRDRKRDIRHGLEGEGLRPIPVYHPLLDGADYFHELAQGYDRVCVANLVRTPERGRRQLMATVAERRQAYPHLWVHLLGVTPDQYLYALPAGDSADSSSWIACTRYRQGHTEHVAGRSSRRLTLPQNFKPQLGRGNRDQPYGRQKSIRMAAVSQATRHANWRHYRARLAELSQPQQQGGTA